MSSVTASVPFAETTLDARTHSSSNLITLVALEMDPYI